uniref:Uncharacterized protein n=1 Tax=Bos mutus grunniens TaxID=30521 RepID=A0A8B9XJK4_BOSMU
MTVSGRTNPYSIMSTEDGCTCSLRRVPTARQWQGARSTGAGITLSRRVAVQHRARQHVRYLAGMLTTCMDICWHSMLLIFSLVFLTSWLLFGIIFSIIAVAHGDHAAGAWPHGAFFSIETQTTIGYGLPCDQGSSAHGGGTVHCGRHQRLPQDWHHHGQDGAAQEARPDAAIQVQCSGGTAQWQGLPHVVRGHLGKSHMWSPMCGPSPSSPGSWRRASTSHWTRSTLMSALTRAWTASSWCLPSPSCTRLMRPALLFGISLQDLETEDSGIVVILEGMVEAMAMTRQACRSYLANEILWGHRFELVLFKEKNQYKIDYSHFHKMSEVPSTSCCSARDLVENKFLLPKHQLLLLQELAAFLSHEEEDEVDGEQDSLSSQATCNFDRPQAGTALVLTDGSLRSEGLEQSV